MSCVLTRRGVAVSYATHRRLYETLQHTLMVTPSFTPGYEPATPVQPRPIFHTKHDDADNTTVMYVPRFALSAIVNDVDSSQRLAAVARLSSIATEFLGELRPEQRVATEAYIDAVSLNDGGGGIIALATGHGKTVAALWLASRFLRVRTLVVVHAAFLMEQWRERIQSFMPRARIGIIQRDTFEVDECDIVIVMIQTLVRRGETFSDEQAAALESIGLVIVDECHHIGAGAFGKAMFHIGAPFHLGLSATPRRKDGLERVFEWHLGPVVYATPANAAVSHGGQVPRVRAIKYTTTDPRHHVREITNQRGQLVIQRMINTLCASKPRCEYLVSLVRTLALEPVPRERYILVLSHRVMHAHTLCVAVRAALPDNVRVGEFHGGVSREQQAENKQRCRVLFATYQMVSEAFDMPVLNTLVLTTPKSDVEQVVGRILRRRHAAEQACPLIVDVYDPVSVFQHQARKRIRFYRSRGYPIANQDSVTTH